MKNNLELLRGVRRVVRTRVLLSLEKELLSQERAIQTDFSPATKKLMKLVAAIAIGGATGIVSVTAIYLVCVWLLHLQL